MAAKQAHAFPDSKRCVGHHTHKMRGMRQRGLQHAVRPACDDGNDEFPLEIVVNLLENLRSIHRLDGQQNAVACAHELTVADHDMHALGCEAFTHLRHLVRDGKLIRRKAAFLQNALQNGGAHVAGSDKTKFHKEFLPVFMSN